MAEPTLERVSKLLAYDPVGLPRAVIQTVRPERLISANEVGQVVLDGRCWTRIVLTYVRGIVVAS